MVRGQRKSAELFRKSERVQESRDRESAEGAENSVRIVAPVSFLSFFLWGQQNPDLATKDHKPRNITPSCVLSSRIHVFPIHVLSHIYVMTYWPDWTRRAIVPGQTATVLLEVMSLSRWQRMKGHLYHDLSGIMCIMHSGCSSIFTNVGN